MLNILKLLFIIPPNSSNRWKMFLCVTIVSMEKMLPIELLNDKKWKIICLFPHL